MEFTVRIRTDYLEYAHFCVDAVGREKKVEKLQDVPHNKVVE